MYLDLLKKCLLNSIYNSVIVGCSTNIGGNASEEQIQNGNYWPEKAHTMIGMKRLNNIEYCFEKIIENKISGDLIETGVWRGGSTIFMAGLNKFYKENRKIFVADSFEGLPHPDPKYTEDNGDEHYKHEYLAVGLDEVKENFIKYDLLDKNIIFIKGFFEHSLKKSSIDNLALLRLDCDMYSSTIQVLEQLYDKVSVGGFVIIDDYALKGSKKAVDDFREKRNILSELIVIDWTGVYWVKE
jgi:O-methyltransferase